MPLNCFKPMIFKFATISIALSSLFVVMAEYKLIEEHNIFENIHDTMTHYFLSLKIFLNICLSLICFVSRTRFDLLVIKMLIDRVFASYAFMSIVIITINVFFIDALNEQLKSIMVIEMYLTLIVLICSIISYLTYIDHKASSIFKNKTS